jgi:hypothetical protein
MELEVCVWPIFDLLALIPVIMIHHKNFSFKKNPGDSSQEQD